MEDESVNPKPVPLFNPWSRVLIGEQVGVPVVLDDPGPILDFSMDKLPHVLYPPRFSNPELRTEKTYKAHKKATAQEEHLSCNLGISNADACRILLEHDTCDSFCYVRDREDQGALIKWPNPADPLSLSPEDLSLIIEDPSDPEKWGPELLSLPVSPESSSLLYSPFLTTEDLGASCHRVYPPAKRPKVPSRNFKDF